MFNNVAAFICGLRLQTFSHEFNFLRGISTSSGHVSNYVAANLDKNLSRSYFCPLVCRSGKVSFKFIKSSPKKNNIKSYLDSNNKSKCSISTFKLLSYLSWVNLSSSMRCFLKALFEKKAFVGKREKYLKRESTSEVFEIVRCASVTNDDLLQSLTS